MSATLEPATFVRGLMLTDLLQSPILFLAILGVAIATSFALGKVEKSAERSVHENLTLEGLRGILALSVFAHHSYYFYHLRQNGNWQDPDTRFWIQLGQPAVELFFMLTSYLFCRKVLDEKGELNWKAYTIRRICRLIPLYLFSVVIVIVSAFALSKWTLRTNASDLFWSVSRWLTLTLFGGPDVNGLNNTWQLDAGVTWTLRFEALFYVFLPVLAFAFTRAKPWIASICGLALTLSLWHYTAFSSDIHVYMKLAPFLGGIAAAFISRNDRLVRFLQNRETGFVAALAILAVLFVAPRGYHPATVSAMTFIFVVAVVENRVFASLRSTPVARLGRISYDVYLLHGLLLWWGTYLLQSLLPSKIFYATFLLFAAAALVVISWCVHRLIELPGMRAGSRWTRSRISRRGHDTAPNRLQ